MTKNNYHPTNNQIPTPDSHTTSSQDLFETIYNQNKNRIHYQLHKLGIHDAHNEFYTEGIYAMWTAYKKYQPDKGPMGTYFNYHIRYRLIDKLRRNTTTLRQTDKVAHHQQTQLDNGNHYGTQKQPLIQKTDIDISDNTFWNYIKSRLTKKQWKWVNGYIINGLTQQEIAQTENVTIDTVKNWARQTRRKLRQEEENLKNMYAEHRERSAVTMNPATKQ